MASRGWIRAILWSALGLIVAAAIVAIAAFRYGLDAYRGEIERRVGQATGRAFHLRGPLALRLSPLVGIESGPAELDNPPGMPGPPFAAWQSARIGLRVLPLLHRQLIVDRVRIEGLQVHLRREADGRTNWADLARPGAAETGGGASGHAAAPTMVGGPIELGKLEIRDGTLDFDDETSARHARLSAIELDVGASRFGRRLEIGPARLAGRLESSGLAMTVRLGLTGVTAAFSPLAVGVPGWSLELASTSEKGSKAAAKGSLAAGEIAGAWRARGPISLRVASVRGLAAMLGLEAPKTADPRALGALELAGDWSLAGDVLGVQSLDAHVDDTTLTGRITRAPAREHDAAEPLIDFELHGDHVDIGRYVAGGRTPDKAFELPVAALRALRAQGSITFGEARYGNVVLKNARLEIPAPQARP